MLLLTLLLLSSAVATSLFALPELVVIVVVVVVVVDDDADVLSVLRATLSHGHSRISMFVPPCKKINIFPIISDFSSSNLVKKKKNRVMSRIIECVTDLDERSKMIILSQTSFLEAAGAVVEIGLSLKPNHHNKAYTSLSKSVTYIVFSSKLLLRAIQKIRVTI